MEVKDVHTVSLHASEAAVQLVHNTLHRQSLLFPGINFRGKHNLLTPTPLTTETNCLYTWLTLSGLR